MIRFDAEKSGIREAGTCTLLPAILFRRIMLTCHVLPVLSAAAATRLLPQYCSTHLINSQIMRAWSWILRIMIRKKP